MKLFVFGLGYAALHLVHRDRDRFESVAGTVTSPAKAAMLAEAGINAHALPAGESLPPAAVAALRRADAVIVSVPPPGDAPFAEALLATGARPAVIGYLSSTAVYGDRDGGWVDRSMAPAPTQESGRERVAAEARWQQVAELVGAAAVRFRIAAIYGPGRNALADLAAGRARRIVRPGQVFNRIHVDDIATALRAGLDARRDMVCDLADELPAANAEVVAHAATLLGMAPPPEVPLADAALTERARLFWTENKRVNGEATRRDLGITLAYPTYREGLAALLSAGEGRPV